MDKWEKTQLSQALEKNTKQVNKMTKSDSMIVRQTVGLCLYLVFFLSNSILLKKMTPMYIYIYF